MFALHKIHWTNDADFDGIGRQDGRTNAHDKQKRH
jgi:hypothetical protein